MTKPHRHLNGMVQMELVFLQPAFKETERSYSESKKPAHESQ